ncbi:MAG TPA: valine--tRNA ligase, partial [Gemmataceae bacterium]|nr:valine--tRNA ligase [Gemmataceae bacterium]
ASIPLHSVNLSLPRTIFQLSSVSVPASEDPEPGWQRPRFYSIAKPMSIELPKQYDPHEAQQRWLTFWDEHGFFHSRPEPGRTPYCIVIPPPNVTGALHMGHALNNTLQDVLIRWRRMQGYNTLWMPGTDHAGIATQAVVERRLRVEEGKTRHDLGREELVKRIWQWKDQYEARILRQLREMGCSCDWARTRFTLDPVCARAVRVTFFKMFRDGLIYRGKRLVNWDTQLQTAVADDEIFHETVKGAFYTFRYPVKGTNEFIRFATTRPETMLGDTAVAVHPDDPRYQHLIGKTAIIPLVNREIPIIADAQLVDPTLGTGAVKVTPAHDPNDYQCGLRHRLPMINILNPDGTINENGGPYAGLDRYVARGRVTEDMEKLGLFDGREDRDIDLAHSDRSKTPIEPYLSDQWFVKMADLAQAAMDAVIDGRVKFFPERYAKTYLDWLGEKRDWCISRQLWWGHRIPIWYAYCPEAELKRAFAGRDDVVWRLDEENTRWLICALEDLPPDALGPKYPLEQDPDVLDTWFSSALWPHSTLGWPGPALPDQEPGPANPDWQQMRYYYPTSVLVTSRDIITLWVARMVITGLYNVGEVPFHHVYIHPKILDAFGETMSKTKGNGIDPLDIIERYGADALRFGMVHIATETQDSRMPVSNVCPHCGTLVPVKREHMYMQTRKVTCPSCKKPFRPGGPWPDEDPDLPTAKQASERFEIGRNFANKLWNAARFLLMNLEGYAPGALRVEELPIEDRWILSRLATATAAITEQLEGYHFSDVARTIYDFTWSEFCDWYVEMSKGRLRDPAGRAAAQRVLVGVLDAILRLVHPVMPFAAESIWQALNEAAFERGLPVPEPSAESVVIAPWPAFPAAWTDLAVEQRIARMQDLVRAVREVRSRYDLKTSVDVFVRCGETVADDFRALAAFITLLAGVGRLECGPNVQKPPQSATHVHPDFEAYVSLRGLIDVDAEAKRLEKQLAEKRKHLQGAQAKLENPNFREKAPAEVVQQQRDLVADLQNQIRAIEANLRELRQA